MSDQYWTVLVRVPEGEGRLGMAIAKKRAKRAVDRNRLKRLVRESFRHHQHQLATLDVVVMNRDATAATESKILTKSLETLWTKALRRLGEPGNPKPRQ